MQRKAKPLGPEEAALGVNTIKCKKKLKSVTYSTMYHFVNFLMPNLSDPAWKSNWERKDPVSGARDKKLFTGGYIANLHFLIEKNLKHTF